MLRSRACEGGGLGHILSHLNNLLLTDMRCGRFMTLLLTMIDPVAGTFRWARAGHDPALLYDSLQDRFEELLDSGGVPVGIDADIEYEEHSHGPLLAGQIIALGTDGIWETVNSQNEFFGKDRLRQVIRDNARQSAACIVAAISERLNTFRGRLPQRDDVTFVVIKVLNNPPSTRV